MPRPRKPRGTSKQQGTSTTRHLNAVPDDAAVDVEGGDEIPAPPPGLRKESVERWERFWTSKLAKYVDPGSDLHRLERWIADVDEFDTLRDAYAKKRVTEGSKGQPRLNPIAGRLATLEKQIVAAENEFGMTPAARLKLGIVFDGAGPTTAADLNAMIDGEGAGDDGEEEVVEEGGEDFAAGFAEA